VAGEQLPSLWGPAPKFTPTASLLQIPDFASEPLFRPPPERLSALRAPLSRPGPSREPLVVSAE
jgi:hypothetical protein